MTQPIRMAALTGGPAASFDEPFQMLEACHERIARTLTLLGRLRAHHAQHGADEQARQAARDVLRYFDLAAPQHHRDEELHVFPALVEGGDAATLALVERLQQDHVRMEAGWQSARQVLAAIEQGRLAHLAPADEAALNDFTSDYASHIEAEEQHAYPQAQALVDGEARVAMGREMKRRRGEP
jgi:hemerythrin-like domain-containing protein